MKLPIDHRAHFSEVFHWSQEVRFDRRTLLVALLAMAVPVLAGQVAGRPALGYVVGLGSMLLAGEAPGQNDAGHSQSPLASIVPVLLAVAVSIGIARLPFSETAMIALVIPAATLTNYSRPAAIGGIRFIVLLVLNMGLVAGGGAHRGGAALLFGIGALWRMLVRLAARRRQRHDIASEAPAGRVPTPRQRRIHWRRMLGKPEGWQYPLRLGAGLAIACLIRDRWPAHHFDWIVLSIVLLTPRELEHLPVRITQRAIGTAGGVLLAGALLLAAPPHLVLAALICLLGAVAPLVRAGNYAAYCVLATPVILLAMDAGAPIEMRLLTDRLVATLAASAIVVGANLAADLWLRAAARGRAASR